MRTLLIWLSVPAALVVVVVVAVGAYFWWDARVSPDISGRIVIYGLAAPEPGESCRTGWAYPDIYGGASAGAHDGETFERLGYGEIAEGNWVDGACIFLFSISNVDNAESYEISIGSLGMHRLIISRKELEERNWHVQFVFGRPPRIRAPDATPVVW
jgi:hypothetical protein